MNEIDTAIYEIPGPPKLEFSVKRSRYRGRGYFKR